MGQKVTVTGIVGEVDGSSLLRLVPWSRPMLPPPRGNTTGHAKILTIQTAVCRPRRPSLQVPRRPGIRVIRQSHWHESPQSQPGPGRAPRWRRRVRTRHWQVTVAQAGNFRLLRCRDFESA